MEELRTQEQQEVTAIAPTTAVTVAVPAKEAVDEALSRAVYLAQRLIDTARQAGMTFKVRSASGEERESLTADGWRLLASWCGFGVVVEVTERIYDDQGELIRVHARARLIRNGEIFGQAEGTAERGETIRRRGNGEEYQRWAEVNDDTLESVAQSRAVAEVCKQNLGFVLRLAGFGEVAAKPTEPTEELSQKDWARFWVQVKELGFNREELHRLYGVETMKEVIKTKQDMERIIGELKELVR